MIKGLVALLVANFIAGAIIPLFVKFGIKELPPITFTAVRFIIATIIFLPFFMQLKKEKVGIKDIKLLSKYSIFFLLNMVIYSIGLQFTTILASQVLYTLVPLIVGIFSFILLKERFSRNEIIGAAVAFCGVAFLFLNSSNTSQSLSFGTFLGNTIIFIGVLMWSMYLTLSKKLTNMYSSATTSFASFLLTGVVLALFVPIELSSRPEVFTHITPGVILSLFGIGSASAIVYFLIQFGIKKTSGFIASLFFYFAPLFASLTAIPFAHEKISLNLIISVVLISVGVFSATTLKQLKRRI